MMKLSTIWYIYINPSKLLFWYILKNLLSAWGFLFNNPGGTLYNDWIYLFNLDTYYDFSMVLNFCFKSLQNLITLVYCYFCCFNNQLICFNIVDEERGWNWRIWGRNVEQAWSVDSRRSYDHLFRQGYQV